MESRKIAIFTDLDGTLIDFNDYSSDLARPYVLQLIELGYLVVFCSSKTFHEQRVLQEELGIEMPCIVENGSAIVAPAGFWDESITPVRMVNGWQRVELGKPAAEIRQRLARVESKFGESLRGFSRMMTEDVASITGLDIGSARRAQEREYSETLSANLPLDVWESLDSAFEYEGLKCLPGGRFHTVIDSSADKGAAIRKFAELWKAQSEETLVSFGLGDSENDQELLENVDWPHLVKRPNGSWAGISGRRIERVNGVGPRGWIKVAKQLLGETPAKV
ncbi:HAD-IIB family hydrolase [Pelagicoccus sp. SDUM812005]|uniref:HAD-IIB family hydrolase n=1 Tax=Pelagicoccus sp. SDUM812005 TaxID=3041257 RepID=UPI00280D3D2B|nr:HAD-IIB family hydrolase [Pelagicoccus sp. SDUM812005]MDQ8182888.1 HAD-IIB family hydrolase [Pelagicoccus sp. SDUM812005]